MASSIPSPQKLEQVRRDILRSIYYRQNLPKSVLAVGASWIRAEQAAFLQRKFIAIVQDEYVLTDIGLSAFRTMSGGRIPNMIRMRRDIFCTKKPKGKFIVGRSLAKEIFREISIDG